MSLSMFVFLLAPLLLTLKLVANYFHDSYSLRRIPCLTPFSALTDLSYIIHNALLPRNTTRTEALAAAHAGKGQILRLGPNHLSFSSPHAIEDIYGTGTRCTKGDQYTTIGGVPNLLTVVDKVDHATKRRRMSAAFTTSHLVAWENKIADKVRVMLVQMDERGPQGVDLRWWTNLFTLDAILDIALSYKPGLLSVGHDSVIAETIHGKMTTVNLLRCLRAINRALEPIIWDKRWFSCMVALTHLWPYYRNEWKLASTWPNIVRHLVNRRLNADPIEGGHDDLFARLQHDKKGKDLGLDMKEILAETSHLIDAGSDTTSVALTHVLYCLARNPAKLAKLRNEIDSAYAIDQIIPTYSQVRSLPYLRACLDEAMRLRPILAAGMQRLTPPEGIMIAGNWVPGGVNVAVSAYIAHRDPLIFGTDANDFRPERWLDADLDKRRQMQRCFLAFSAGARVCIGKNITYMEQSILVAAMVKRYDFKLPSTQWEMDWEEFFNMWPRELPMILQRRSGSI